MNQKILFTFFLATGLNFLFAQNDIQSGPMVGYCTTREVALWIQLTHPSNVIIKYFEKVKNAKKFTTLEKKAIKSEYFVVKLIADSVLPGKTYNYEVFINGKKKEFDFPLQFKTPPNWRYRTEEPNFTIACGSGTYINDSIYDRKGKPYGAKVNIFEEIYHKKPDIMLWLGDNIYLRSEEWASNTGIAYRYTNTRSVKVIRQLMASTANYAIWDDHDAGPNDCDGSFWNIENTLRFFNLFWANPGTGVKDIKGAISFFNWGNVDFFLLDNRYYRDPDHLKATSKTLLGEKQKKWFLNALVSSNASFKIVAMGGQFLNSAKNFETYSNYGFEKERQEILDFIDTQKLKNVIFLTGDRHFTELSYLQTAKNKIEIYDFTVSPLTSGPAESAKDEINKYRVPETSVMQRNFGFISYISSKKACKLQSFDTEGNLLWEKYIFKK